MPTQNPSDPTSRRRALTAGGIRPSIPQCSGVSGSAARRAGFLSPGRTRGGVSGLLADELIMSIIERFST